MDKGAHFRRCDFQVHTPRDVNWNGIRPNTPEDRMQLAVQLVEACRQRDIGGIAVTDHHDFAYVETVREAAASERDDKGLLRALEDRLVVFPGVELTLGVPCQALLILDADFPVERLNTVLDILSVDIVDPSLSTLPSVQRIDHIQSLKQLHEELDRNSWLRGSYIVLPNVTDGGLGTLMRSGMQQKYKEMPCVGGYLDGSIDRIGEGNQRKFDGLDAAWGNKAIALFQTSDSRHDSFVNLGVHSTWVKWATPTAEALRQACLARESRISHVRPALPELVVTRLSVSNSRFMGPIELELNPQYNAIIGGRGTGKSTCLEYLRWALCDQPSVGGGADDLPDHVLRRQRLIDATLAPFDSHVEAHFVVHGIRHVVRRFAKTGDVMLKVGSEEFAPAHPDDVRSLLPVDAYSQRQLSSVAVRLDELTRFVNAPIRRELEAISTKEAALAAETRRNYVDLQRQRSLARSLAADDVTVASLAQQAANLRESLGAVSEDDQRILEAKAAHDAADELVGGWSRQISQGREAARAFQAEIERIRAGLRRPTEAQVSLSGALAPLGESLRTLFDELKEASEASDAVLARLVEGPRSEIARFLAQWQEAKADFEQRYGQAKERSSAHQSQLTALDELEKRRRSLQASIDQRKEELSSLGAPDEQHVRLRTEWRELQEERSRRIAQQCDALTTLSGGLIRASLRHGGGLKVLGDRFRAAVTGSGIRGAKLDALFDALGLAEAPLHEWERSLGQLEEMVAAVGQLQADAGLFREQTTLTEVFSAAELNKIAQKITPEALLSLILTSLEDVPSFEYRTKEGEYIAFDVASAGQQATALLRVLLNQAGPPLLIDQPEDDLDSQVINDVVSQIWKAKGQRQLIFSSHNANLVVNGDAELVVCCDYRAAGDQSGGRVKLEGAIDMPTVRDEITVVMEGGERAFRLRKEKYGF